MQSKAMSVIVIQVQFSRLLYRFRLSRTLYYYYAFHEYGQQVFFTISTSTPCALRLSLGNEQ